MKPIITLFCTAALALVVASFPSCKKDDSKINYGVDNIYMPQALNVSAAVNNNYTVPNGTDTSTYNYIINDTAGKINIILGTAVAGEGSTAGYAVTVQTNADTINTLLASGVLDTSTILMPASLYTLPSGITVPEGKTEGTFYLAVDIAQLKQSQYAGKKLALAVALASPTKYKLNTAISTTIVILDVDAIVIGPPTDITSQYIQNAGSPFTAVQPQSGRWGILADWSYNYAVADPSILSHHADFTTDANGSFQMERYGSPQVLNGKIFQTVTLPAGSYSLSPQNYTWQGVLDPVYLVAAQMDSLPDYGTIPSAALAYTTMYNNLSFKVTSPGPVSLGVVVNFVQDQQGFAFTGIKLYTYPKHL